MKGFLALLLTGLFPITYGISQETTPTPTSPEDKSITFSLRLNEELIEELKSNPGGLIAVIPEEQRGSVDRVKLYYDAPPESPVGSATRMKVPQTQGRSDFEGPQQPPSIASSRPTLNEGFRGLPPIESNRNSQSNIFNNPTQDSEIRSIYEPNQFGRQFPNQNQRARQAQSPVVNVGSTDNPGWQTSGKQEPVVDQDLATQYEILKQQADGLQTQRIAQQQQQNQQAMIDKIVEERIRLREEQMMQQLRATQRANQDNRQLGPQYEVPTYQQPAVPSRQRERTDSFADTDYDFEGGNLDGYGQRLVNESGRGITRVSMAPRLTHTPSPEHLIDQTKKTTPTSTVPNSTEPTMGIPPEDSNTETTQPTTDSTLLLLFLFVCSVAINIVLGWVAYGAYGRYKDLAAELRETFSTST